VFPLVASLALTPGQMRAQILHADGPLPSFDVSSIKRSNGTEALPSIATPIQVRTVHVTARNLIEQAFNIPWTPDSNELVIGGSGWVDNDYFNLDARMDESLAPAFEKMSHEEQKRQRSLMLQSLLAVRFKLKVRFETRELPVYALSIAKSGPRPALAQHTSPLPTDETRSVSFPTTAQGLSRGIFVQYRGQSAEMTAKAATLDEVAHWLAGYSEIGGRPVVNQTALTGSYDFTLRWTRERLAAQTEASDSDAPALFTALQEQLGLRLLATKAPVEVIVIDHIEPPSHN